jgi:hypothetical protein
MIIRRKYITSVSFYVRKIKVKNRCFSMSNALKDKGNS